MTLTTELVEWWHGRLGTTNGVRQVPAPHCRAHAVGARSGLWRVDALSRPRLYRMLASLGAS